jgi:flagellin-specific chaperone FliS
LKDAKAHFSKYLDDKEKAEAANFRMWIVRFYEKVIQQLRVSQYIVEQSSEVGVIFEVMNNRGKPLSELDKAKNYLMYLASKLEVDEPHDLADRVNGTWAEMFRRLMASDLNSSADEDRLLRAHWLMVYNPNPREWSGSDSIKQKYNLKGYHGRHRELLDGLAGYVRSLRDAVVPFCEAFRPLHSGAFGLFPEPGRAGAKKAGDKLRRLKVVAPFVPALTACRLRFPNDPTKYLELLRLSEIFAFRVYRVKQRRADAGQAILFKLGHDLFHEKISFDEALVAIRHLALLHCSNAELRDDCALDDLEKDWYQWNPLRYVLYEYEEHLAGKNGVKVSWDVFDTGDPQRTTEHILPQTVEGSNGKYWRDRFNREQRRRFTHDIGNLCLTEDNSAYGNKPFPEKKGNPGAGRCYANSNLFQERELACEVDWTENTILKRRKQIIAWYLERWHLDDSDFPGGRVEGEQPLELE